MTLKGFQNDGWGNSVSDEEARLLEKKYLRKWADFRMDYGVIIRGKIINLYWSESYHSGPLVLACEFCDKEGKKFKARISQIIHLYKKKP